ncbi:MAG: hypothetical protein F7B59_05160 [Desulfurococcales archaeon]|nr:hypothetical protein [Desulfurococcales archaeon]
MTIIAPPSYKFKKRMEGASFYKVLDIQDQTVKLLENAGKEDLIILVDLTFFYRENPIDPTISRLTVFQLALLRYHADKYVSISTIEPCEQPDRVSAFKYASFYGDCICRIDRGSSEKEFKVESIYTSSRKIRKLSVVFLEDGGMTWTSLD